MNSWYLSLAKLFEEHRRHLVSMAFRRTRDRETAAEIVQDVYTRLLQSGGTGRNEGDTKILYASVRNALIDHHRSVLNRRNVLENVLPAQLGSAEPHSPEQQVMAQQSLAALYDALLELTPRAREMFILHRVEGVSNAALAKRYGISVSAVEKQLARVMRHCQKSLGR